MKLTCQIIATLFIICSTLFAEEPALPTVRAVLGPLRAKVDGRHWAFKGIVLSFRAEQALTEEQWKALEGLGVKQTITDGKGIDDAARQKLKALPNLKTLDLQFVDISAEDLDKLRAEMPAVKIPLRPPMTDAERKRLEGFLKVE